MKQTLSPFKAGDRIVYRDDEAPFAEHAATILPKREGQPEDWFDVQPDDIADDTPSIHESLIVRKTTSASATKDGISIFNLKPGTVLHHEGDGIIRTVSYIQRCGMSGAYVALTNGSHIGWSSLPFWKTMPKPEPPIMCPECNEAMGHKDQCSRAGKCKFCGSLPVERATWSLENKELDEYGYCQSCINGMARTNGD